MCSKSRKKKLPYQDLYATKYTHICMNHIKHITHMPIPCIKIAINEQYILKKAFLKENCVCFVFKMFKLSVFFLLSLFNAYLLRHYGQYGLCHCDLFSFSSSFLCKVALSQMVIRVALSSLVLLSKGRVSLLLEVTSCTNHTNSKGDDS